jgi:hypothetical protein
MVETWKNGRVGLARLRRRWDTADHTPVRGATGHFLSFGSFGETYTICQGQGHE